TLAYQGALLRRETEEEALEWLRAVSEPVIIRPDIVFLLDLPPERAMERLSFRHTRSKFEVLSYLKEVHDIYHRIAHEDSNYLLLDATRPVDEVVDEILRAINNNL
ncbi:MAG: dTMP kinase, partial [Methanomassiliicoccales archaeon]